LQYIDCKNDGTLVFNETESPSIAVNECLVRVRAIGVNRADILQRQGKYPPPLGESPILGIEVCGEIIACGKQVSNWQQGDKVMSLVAGGAYAEFVKINSAHLMRLPASYTYEQGAAIAEVFLTAYQCLFAIAELEPYQKVLIHAGASGVGTAAIQLAKIKHCEVTVTVGSENKRDACLGLGADYALNYHETDFQQWAKEHNKKYDVILDVVAGEYINKNVNVAARDGKVVILSMLGGRYVSELDIAKLLLKRISIQATTLRNRDDLYKQALVDSFIDTFKGCFTTNELKPIIDSVYSWHDVEQAHQKLINNENIGKVILVVD